MATSATPRSGIDRWFEISARGSTYGREIRGGVVTFVTMAYIVVLNPLIIGTAMDVNGNYIGGGTDVVKAITMVTAATALLAGLLTILMGVIGRFPVALAAGLGLNGVLAFSLAPRMTWADALGIVVIEGVIILLLVLTGFRTAVFEAVPEDLKYAIGVGIGLFITVIGLVDSGLVRSGVPLVQWGINGKLDGWPMLTFVIGLLLIAVLVARKVKGGILIGMAVTTVFAIVVESINNIGPANSDPAAPGLENPTGWGLNVPAIPESFVATPDFGSFFQFNLFGSFEAIGVLAAILAIFSLMLSDFFDTMGTVFGIATEGNMLDKDGKVPHLQGILAVDSIAAAAGGIGGTSSNTSYIESASGVGEGARTGFANLVTGGLFLLSVFIAPLVTVIPYEAATPALVIVGFLMMTQIKNIRFDDYAIGIPAFLTIALMPFSYNITVGIGAGFVSYTLIKLTQGKAKDVKPLMWVSSAAFIVYFAIAPIERLLGL